MKMGRRSSRDRTSVRMTVKENRDYRERDYRENNIRYGYIDYRAIAESKLRGKSAVSQADFIMLLKESGFMINDDVKSLIVSSFDTDKAKYTFEDLTKVLNMLQESKASEDGVDDEAEYIDAFLAMGGNADKTGYVTKAKIAETINEFELTIDIVDFLDQIPDDLIDFASFCRLFEQPFDDSKSVLSLKTVKSFDADHVRKVQSNKFRLCCTI